MVITLLNWSLFIFFILLYLLVYIGFWGILIDNTNKENKGNGLSIFISGMVAAFMFIPAKEVLNPNAAVILWKSLAALTGISSLIVMIFSDKIKQRMRYYVWGVFFTILISIVPFVIRISISKSDATAVDFNNQYFISPFVFTSAIVVVLSIIVLIIVVVSTTKTKRRILEQNQLLSYYLNEYNHNTISFRKPYENMLKEEFFSWFNQFEKRLSSVIRVSDNKEKAKPIKKTTKAVDSGDLNNKIDEIQKALMVLGDEMRHNQINNFDIIRDLNHFFATPFATIEANVEILNKETGVNRTNLDKISNAVQLCKCIIETYRESLSFINSHNNVTNSLKSTVEMAFYTYSERNNKKLTPLNVINIPEQFNSHINHYIVSLILPLLENAIQAAPNNTEIQIVFDNANNSIYISNLCEKTPTLNDLKTPGFSSKENHKGTGIIIVKNLLSIKDRGSLETTVEDNKVTQTIKLN